jgi:chitinase
VALTWVASSDNVKVTGYRVYRDGVLVASISRTKWTDGLNLSAGTRSYEVVAFDAAGNVSPPAALTVE